MQVRLARDHEGWTVEIGDNGRGMAATDRAKGGSFGIHGMTERAQAAGGSVALGEAPGGGTEVLLRMPLKAPVPPRAGRARRIRTPRHAPARMQP